MLKKKGYGGVLLAAIILALPACQPVKPTQNEIPATGHTDDRTTAPNQESGSKQNRSQKTLASEIYEEAKQGKAFFCEFALGTKKDVIIKQWGKPDAESSDTFLTYQKHSVTFLTDPNSQQITLISSDHPTFQRMLIAQVKKELGTPLQEKRIPDENLIQAVYQAGDYRLVYVYDDSDKTVRYIELTQTRQETFLQQVMTRAAAGKVTNSEFDLGTKENTILAQWGRPEEQDTGFLFYKKKGVLFSIDEPAKTVSMITSYDPELGTYTLEQVKKALGKPIKEYGSDGDYMLYYKSGTHSIYFGFDYPNEKNGINPKLLYVYVV